MKKPSVCLNNENGSAMLVAILLVPMVTLICVFAANIAYQDVTVSAIDECNRDALYDGDGGIYTASKLIAHIGKHRDRKAVQTGPGQDGPGVVYSNSEPDPAEGFVRVVSGNAGASTDEDVEFIKSDTVNDIGIQAVVDVRKGRVGAPAGGGAEFGSGNEGAGTSMNSAVTFNLTSTGESPCNGPPNTVQGDFFMVPDSISPKGI